MTSTLPAPTSTAVQTLPAPPSPMRLPTPPSFPLRPEDESWAIEQLAKAAERVMHLLLKKIDPEQDKVRMKETLREGRARWFALQAINGANKGDYIADGALREAGDELVGMLVQGQVHGQALSAAQQLVMQHFRDVQARAPLKRNRGQYTKYDLAGRNMAIAALIQLASKWFGVAETRELDLRRGDSPPSGVSLTSAALARHSIDLTEETIQRHIWFKHWGRTVQDAPGEYLAPWAI